MKLGRKITYCNMSVDFSVGAVLIWARGFVVGTP